MLLVGLIDFSRLAAASSPEPLGPQGMVNTILVGGSPGGAGRGPPPDEDAALVGIALIGIAGNKFSNLSEASKTSLDNATAFTRASRQAASTRWHTGAVTSHSTAQ